MQRLGGFQLVLLVFAMLAGCGQLPRENTPVAKVLDLGTEKMKQQGDVTVYTLPNALTLIHKKTTANSIVGMTMFVRSGASEDDPERAGLSSLVMRVLSKGTESRDADQIAEEIAQLGANFSASPGQDYCHASMKCVNSDFEEAMELFADLLKNPIFPVEQVDLERVKLIAAIRRGDDRPSVVAGRKFRREIFGQHPYGTPVTGMPETLQNVQASDLYTKHRAVFVPSNMVLSVVGNIDIEKLEKIISENFPDPMPQRERRLVADKIITPGGTNHRIVKDSEQSYMIMGHLVCGEGDPDEPAVEVAASILGSGMSSRLFTELRDNRGLAYEVGCSASFHKYKGMLVCYIGTNPENTKLPSQPVPSLSDLEGGLPVFGEDDEIVPKGSLVEEAMWGEIEKLRTTPVEQDELDRVKNYIAGEYLRQNERNSSQAYYLGYWYLADRGVEYDHKYLDDIRAVSSRDVMKVANKYFLEPTVVIVGPQ